MQVRQPPSRSRSTWHGGIAQSKSEINLRRRHFGRNMRAMRRRCLGAAWRQEISFDVVLSMYFPVLQGILSTRSPSKSCCDLSVRDSAMSCHPMSFPCGARISQGDLACLLLRHAFQPVSCVLALQAKIPTVAAGRSSMRAMPSWTQCQSAMWFSSVRDDQVVVRALVTAYLWCLGARLSYKQSG